LPGDVPVVHQLCLELVDDFFGLDLLRWEICLGAFDEGGVDHRGVDKKGVNDEGVDKGVVDKGGIEKEGGDKEGVDATAEC